MYCALLSQMETFAQNSLLKTGNSGTRCRGTGTEGNEQLTYGYIKGQKECEGKGAGNTKNHMEH